MLIMTQCRRIRNGKGSGSVSDERDIIVFYITVLGLIGMGLNEE